MEIYMKLSFIICILFNYVNLCESEDKCHDVSYPHSILGAVYDISSLFNGRLTECRRTLYFPGTVSLTLNITDIILPEKKLVIYDGLNTGQRHIKFSGNLLLYKGRCGKKGHVDVKSVKTEIEVKQNLTEHLCIEYQPPAGPYYSGFLVGDYSQYPLKIKMEVRINAILCDKTVVSVISKDLSTNTHQDSINCSTICTVNGGNYTKCFETTPKLTTTNPDPYLLPTTTTHPIIGGVDTLATTRKHHTPTIGTETLQSETSFFGETSTANTNLAESNRQGPTRQHSIPTNAQLPTHYLTRSSHENYVSNDSVSGKHLHKQITTIQPIITRPTQDDNVKNYTVPKEKSISTINVSVTNVPSEITNGLTISKTTDLLQSLSTGETGTKQVTKIIEITTIGGKLNTENNDFRSPLTSSAKTTRVTTTENTVTTIATIATSVVSTENTKSVITNSDLLIGLYTTSGLAVFFFIILVIICSCNCSKRRDSVVGYSHNTAGNLSFDDIQFCGQWRRKWIMKPKFLDTYSLPRTPDLSNTPVSQISNDPRLYSRQKALLSKMQSCGSQTSERSHGLSHYSLQHKESIYDNIGEMACRIRTDSLKSDIQTQTDFTVQLSGDEVTNPSMNLNINDIDGTGKNIHICTNSNNVDQNKSNIERACSQEMSQSRRLSDMYSKVESKITPSDVVSTGESSTIHF